MHRKHGAVDILGAVASRPPHDDLVTVFVPLQDGTGPNAQPPPYLSRN